MGLLLTGTVMVFFVLIIDGNPKLQTCAEMIIDMQRHLLSGDRHNTQTWNNSFSPVDFGQVLP